MAKIALVTRTIKTTKVKALAVNLDTTAVEEHEVVLPRTYKDNADILATLTKNHNTASLSFVKVISAVVEENLFGMTEAKFLENAEKLPPRSAKADEEDTAE